MRLQTPRAGGPARNRYIYTYIRVHRTIDSPHFSGPSLRVRQFRMSFFPFFFFFFLFILPAIRRNLPRSERRPFVTGRIPMRARLQDFLMATACVPSTKNRTRRRDHTIAQIGRVRRFDYSITRNRSVSAGSNTRRGYS